jgi:DNA helicase-2/ATP-dependent DNA helicase PcrA
VERPRSADKPRLVTVATRPTRPATSSTACWSGASRHGAEGAGGAVPHLHHSGPLEVELTRRNIPFVKFGGLKFLDSAHVKDVLAVLRFGENPRDRVAGFRVLQLLPGIGPATAGRRSTAMAESFAERARPRCRRPPRGEDWPPSSTRSGPARRPPAGRRDRATSAALVRAASRPHPRRRRARQADLVQLEQIAAGYPSRERFLTELTLDPPDATSDQAGPPLLDEDYLILSTIHSAKGQEWRSVFVLNVVDGCIPSDLGDRLAAEIEEERRLLYVAMTRARDDSGADGVSTCTARRRAATAALLRARAPVRPRRGDRRRATSTPVAAHCRFRRPRRWTTARGRRGRR